MHHGKLFQILQATSYLHLDQLYSLTTGKSDKVLMNLNDPPARWNSCLGSGSLRKGGQALCNSVTQPVWLPVSRRVTETPEETNATCLPSARRSFRKGATAGQACASHRGGKRGTGGHGEGGGNVGGGGEGAGAQRWTLERRTLRVRLVSYPHKQAEVRWRTDRPDESQARIRAGPARRLWMWPSCCITSAPSYWNFMWVVQRLSLHELHAVTVWFQSWRKSVWESERNIGHGRAEN